MNKSKSKRVLVRILGVAAFGAIATGIAWATPPSGVSTVMLNAGPAFLPDGVKLKSIADGHHVEFKIWGDSDVYVVENTIVPGGHTGWHQHPGVSVISVKSGVATEYHPDAPTVGHVYAAGSAFAEDAGEPHLIRNEGTTNLVLVAFQVIPRGATRRIDMPAP